MLQISLGKCLMNALFGWLANGGKLAILKLSCEPVVRYT